MRPYCSPEHVTHTETKAYAGNRPRKAWCRTCLEDIPIWKAYYRCCVECPPVCADCWANIRLNKH